MKQGTPRVGAAVDVLERVDLPGVEWRFVTSVHTARDGGFSFRAVPGPARVLRFIYSGTPTTRPGTDEVELRVRAGATLTPDRRSVRNGEAVVFRGRLLGAPVPEAGKLVLLQAF